MTTRLVAQCPRCGWQGLDGDCAFLDDRGLGIDPICPACWEEAVPVRRTGEPICLPAEKPFRVGDVIVVHEGDFPLPGRVVEIKPPAHGHAWNALSVEMWDGSVRYFPAFDRRLDRKG